MSDWRVRITVRVSGRSGSESVGPAMPAGVGVPFPRGLVFGNEPTPNRPIPNVAGLELVRAASSEPLPLQQRIAATWPDGSVKWLFVDTVAALADGEILELRSTGKEAPAPPSPAITLNVTDSLKRLVVDTGPMVFTVRRDFFNVIDKVWLREGERNRLVARGSARGVVVINSAHEEFRSANEWRDYRTQYAELESCQRGGYDLQFEDPGPLKLSLRCRGRCLDKNGRAIMNAIVRLTAWAGLPFIQATMTVIFVGDPDRDFVKAVGLEAPLWTPVHRFAKSPVGERVASFNLDGIWKEVAIPPQKEGCAGYGYLYVCQRDAGAAVVNRYWTKDDRFTDYGRRAVGVADLSVSGHGLTVFQRKFDREWPCEICVDARENSIVAYPFALHWHDFLIFSRGRDDTTSPGSGGEGRPDNGLGAAKSTDLLLHYHLGAFDKEQAEAIHASFESPALLWVDPEWVSDSDALGFAFLPRDAAKHPRAEAAIEKYLDENLSYRDRFGWRGYITNGDCQRSWSSLWKRWGAGFSCAGWLNNELALDQAWWLAYLRSGERRYHVAAEDLTRHVIDVDTAHPLDFRDVHFRRDYDNIAWDYPALRIGGCHRHHILHWGDTPCPGHTFIDGHLLYYYLTGDRRGLEVALEAGEFFFAAHRGGLTRGMANALRAFSLLYDATHSEDYLEAGNEVAEILLRGQLPGGGWPGSYDISRDQWGTQFDPWMSSYVLRALHVYHRATGDERAKVAYVKTVDVYCAMEGNFGLPPLSEVLFHLAYAHRLTGDQKYLDRARQLIDTFCEATEKYQPSSDIEHYWPLGAFDVLIGLGMPAALAALENGANTAGS